MEVLRFTCIGQQELKHRFAVPSVAPLRREMFRVACLLSIQRAMERAGGRREGEIKRERVRVLIF